MWFEPWTCIILLVSNSLFYFLYSSQSSLWITNLKPYTSYQCDVRAIVGGVTGKWSLPVINLTQEGGMTVWKVFIKLNLQSCLTWCREFIKLYATELPEIVSTIYQIKCYWATWNSVESLSNWMLLSYLKCEGLQRLYKVLLNVIFKLISFER